MKALHYENLFATLDASRSAAASALRQIPYRTHPSSVSDNSNDLSRIRQALDEILQNRKSVQTINQEAILDKVIT